MAIRRRKLIRGKMTPEVSFTEAQVREEIPRQQTIKPENEIEIRAATPVQSENAGPGPFLQRIEPVKSILMRAFNRKLSLLQYLLVAIVILSAVLLTYSTLSLHYFRKTPASVQINVAPQPRPVAQTNETSQSPDAGANAGRHATEPVEVPAGQSEPLSLQLSEIYYTSKDYVKAYNAYEQLRRNIVAADFEPVRDFLLLRMALCQEKLGSFDKAREQFRLVAESRSVSLRAVANYRCALLEMNAGQYLQARARAYKAIALTPALSSDFEWALDLERDCTYLAAEALTRRILSLCDADKELPGQLWAGLTETEPLTGLNEKELRKLLNTGVEQLNGGLLAPQVRLLESADGAPGLARWSIVCNGPGIDELIARFAANAALDVKWIHPADGPAATTTAYSRPVVLYLPAATTQQVVATACGAAGLMANIDDSNTIIITNPAEYSALSEHTRQLSEHAIWLWRKLLLMYSDDQRIPNVHFALGVLQSRKDRLAEAITEFKLVANRYSNSPLAPYALLHSSRLKTGLRDYAGASRDLKQLIEQHPDNELTGLANLNLAETTFKAGLYEEACSLYRKTYNLGFSTESQAQAGFGAGKCFYQLNDYESAVKWLRRFLDAAAVQQKSAQSAAKQQSRLSDELYTAYLLLGKANLALGNLEAACDALNRTMRRAATSDEYIEAVTALIETQLKQENFVEALATVENVRAWPFSQEQITRLLLLKSRVLRTIGLTDQAITLLTDRAQYLTDNQLRAGLTLELARCQVAVNNLDLARTYLTEALSLFEPGAMAQDASVELAEVCLKSGDDQQSISICTRLLASPVSQEVKHRASKILASAYSKQQEYDKAAITLMTASVKK